MDSGESGMNPVTMNAINPRKEYWPSRGIEPATSGSQILYTPDRAMGLEFVDEYKDTSQLDK